MNFPPKYNLNAYLREVQISVLSVLLSILSVVLKLGRKGKRR